MFGPFKPAPHIAELPAEKIDSTYKRLRWQVFAGIFFGYAAYYFVRANFDLAQHCHHVGNDLLKWLVPRYGLASMWSYNGTLVV